MPTYEYECHGKTCAKKNIPHEFTGFQPLDKFKEVCACPKCGKKGKVKKVIRTPHVKSQSWRTF